MSDQTISQMSTADFDYLAAAQSRFRELLKIYEAVNAPPGPVILSAQDTLAAATIAIAESLREIAASLDTIAGQGATNVRRHDATA